MNDDYLENLFYILSTHNIDKYHKDTKPLMHTPLSYCTPTSKTILQQLPPTKYLHERIMEADVLEANTWIAEICYKK